MGNRANPRWPDRLALAALLGAATLGGGCTAVIVAGKTVSTTVGVAADVTSATVRGTGKVAAAAVGASGNVADESLRAAARLSKKGMVVFFYSKTGAVFETPWKKGLKLLTAADAAKVDPVFSTARVIREGNAIDSAGQVATLAVKSGDVVELTRGI
jgi:hypothetical protein